MLCTHFIPKDDWLAIRRAYPLGTIYAELSAKVYYGQPLSRDFRLQWVPTWDRVMSDLEETWRSTHETKQAFLNWQEVTLAYDDSPDNLEVHPWPRQ